MTDIEYCESRIREYRAECEDLRKKEKYRKAAQDSRDIYESYVNVGFTEEQAWELFKILFERSLKGE